MPREAFYPAFVAWKKGHRAMRHSHRRQHTTINPITNSPEECLRSMLGDSGILHLPRTHESDGVPFSIGKYASTDC